MEFNAAIFKKYYQQQIYPWTMQLTHKPQSDPFAQMHFDNSTCIYQEVITDLSNNFTQNLAFPAVFRRYCQ